MRRLRGCSLPALTVAVALGLWAVEPAAFAAPSATASKQAQARYEKERAACLSGKSTEDRATCLKEAGAARAARSEGQLGNDAVSPGNATARCKPLTGADRQACEQRMHGAGTESGSVAGGGILRELVQTVPAASAPGN